VEFVLWLVVEAAVGVFTVAAMDDAHECLR
jgi:hypothetical protein